VIAHLKDGNLMGRNHLKGREGDCANAVLAAAGYNFGLLLRWLQELLCALLQMFAMTAASLTPPSNQLRKA
jgi:IS5 family transposase